MSDLQAVGQKPRGQCRSEEQGGQSGARGASRGKHGHGLRLRLGSDTQSCCASRCLLRTPILWMCADRC